MTKGGVSWVNLLGRWYNMTVYMETHSSRR